MKHRPRIIIRHINDRSDRAANAGGPYGNEFKSDVADLGEHRAPARRHLAQQGRHDGHFQGTGRRPRSHWPRLNLDGDRQADLSVHGGEHKAVYCYPIEHYDYWQGALPGRGCRWGVFGENFTTSGLAEDAVHLGDRFVDRFGAGRRHSAPASLLQARASRFQLGRHGQAIPRPVDRPDSTSRSTRKGDVGAGDAIRVIARDPHAVPVSEITRLYIADLYSADDVASARRALQVAALPESWKDYLRERLQRTQA